MCVSVYVFVLTWQYQYQNAVFWNDVYNDTGKHSASRFTSKVIPIVISSLRWMVLLPAALKGNTTEHDESKRSDIWLQASLSEATLTGL